MLGSIETFLILKNFVYHENPSARGAYMLRKFVCVGFHSSPGKDACAVMTGYHEKRPQITQIYTDYKKKYKKICVICGFFFFIVSG
jgi:hypothetical protein